MKWKLLQRIDGHFYERKRCSNYLRAIVRGCGCNRQMLKFTRVSKNSSSVYESRTRPELNNANKAMGSMAIPPFNNDKLAVLMRKLYSQGRTTIGKVLFRMRYAVNVARANDNLPSHLLLNRRASGKLLSLYKSIYLVLLCVHSLLSSINSPFRIAYIETLEFSKRNIWISRNRITFLFLETSKKWKFYIGYWETLKFPKYSSQIFRNLASVLIFKNV